MKVLRRLLLGLREIRLRLTPIALGGAEPDGILRSAGLELGKDNGQCVESAAARDLQHDQLLFVWIGLGQKVAASTRREIRERITTSRSCRWR
jgi:hypothetical protein